MIHKIKTLILSLSAVFALALPLAVPAAVYAADIQGGLCQGANLNLAETSDASCKTNNELGVSGFQKTLTKIINIISVIIGVVAVIMIIFGGFRYITSGGDSAKVTSAKNTILYALIGLVIVALAQLIVKFVLNGTANSIS